MSATLLAVLSRYFIRKRWLSRGICCLAVLACARVSVAQLAPETQLPDAILVPRCHRVWVASENTTTNEALILEKLRLRGELTDARIALTESEPEADVSVKVAGDEHDAVVFARRKLDGAIASSKVVALAEFPGIIAGSIVDTLHELCPAVMTTNRWFRSGREPLPTMAVTQIAVARSVSVTSNTSAMDEKELARFLRMQPEVESLELQIDTDKHSDDLKLEIDRDLKNPIVWKYEVFSRSGDSLLIGWVGALNHKHAAEAITRNVLREFKRCRPAQTRSALVISNANANPVRAERTYRLRLITDEPRSTGTLLNVTVDAEKLLATNSLQEEVLRIEAPDFEDATSSSIRDAALDYPDQFMDVVGFLCTTPMPAALLGPALLAGYTAASMVSAPFAPRAHLIDIAWHDGHSYQDTTLQVQAKDVAPLMRALRALKGSN